MIHQWLETILLSKFMGPQLNLQFDNEQYIGG